VSCQLAIRTPSATRPTRRTRRCGRPCRAVTESLMPSRAGPHRFGRMPATSSTRPRSAPCRSPRDPSDTRRPGQVADPCVPDRLRGRRGARSRRTPRATACTGARAANGGRPSYANAAASPATNANDARPSTSILRFSTDPVVATTRGWTRGALRASSPGQRRAVPVVHALRATRRDDHRAAGLRPSRARAASRRPSSRRPPRPPPRRSRSFDGHAGVSGREALDRRGEGIGGREACRASSRSRSRRARTLVR
jgi:hypothetical protein